MAILKYQDKNGNYISVNSYKINNVIVSQDKGQSTADVMSQKAVTDEITALESTIATKANSSDVYTKSETDSKLSEKANTSAIPTKVSQLTNDSGYLTQHQSLNNYYNKTESDGKYQPKGNYLISHQSLADYAKKTEVANADTALQNDIDANEAAVTAALNKLKQSAGFDTNGNYNNSDYTSLADAIDDLVSRLGNIETDGVIDCGEYGV